MPPFFVATRKEVARRGETRPITANRRHPKIEAARIKNTGPRLAPGRRIVAGCRARNVFRRQSIHTPEVLPGRPDRRRHASWRGWASRFGAKPTLCVQAHLGASRLKLRIAPFRFGAMVILGLADSANPASPGACGLVLASGRPLFRRLSRCASRRWAMRVSLRGGMPRAQRTSTRPPDTSLLRALRRLFAPRHRRCAEAWIGRSIQPS